MIENLWAVCWDARGAMLVMKVDELVTRNRLRFLAGEAGYGLLGFAERMEDALEAKRAARREREER